MSYERSIHQAKDRITNKLLNADEIFRITKDAFEIRRQYHAREIEPYCCECDQNLTVSTSKNDRLYFKHLPNSEPCILKDGNLTVLEMQQINDILVAKESDRHKFLKNRIAELLVKTDGVLTESVFADNKFIYNLNEKRRPDVYCRFRDKELVFEIQLSNLSLKYILDRTNFYKKKGIYLIWILDKFNIHGQSQMERDIKYLTAFHNFFKLDEESSNFKLVCTYKNPFVSDRNIVISPWTVKSVSLLEVKFDPNTFQIYYLNYSNKLKEAETLLKEILQKEEQQEKKRLLNEQKEIADEKSNKLIAQIANHKKRGWAFYQFPEYLDDFDEFQLNVLNEKLGFTYKKHLGKPLINYYISTAQPSNHSFIDFLLKENRIAIDVNKVDENGISCFQELFLNKSLSFKGNLIKNLFKRGYELLNEDITFFRSSEIESYDKTAELLLFSYYNRLADRDLVDYAFKHSNLLYIIESAKQQKIISFRYTNWIAFGINAIHSYKQFWEYIELAFKKYGLWDILINADRKGTFQKKLTQFYYDIPEQNFTIDAVIKELFGELFK